ADGAGTRWRPFETRGCTVVLCAGGSRTVSLFAHCGSAPLARRAFSMSSRAAVQVVNGSARYLAARNCVGSDHVAQCRTAVGPRGASGPGQRQARLYVV